MNIERNKFLEGIAGKEGGDLFQGEVAIFEIKNNLKFGIFDDKKSLDSLRGALTVCRLKEGLARTRGGGIFEGGGLIPQCTLCITANFEQKMR